MKRSIERYQWTKLGMLKNDNRMSDWIKLEDYGSAWVENLELKRVVTKLGKRLKMVQQANNMLAAHNLTLVTLMADRGINCERIIRGDRAEAKLAKVAAVMGENGTMTLHEFMGIIYAE